MTPYYQDASVTLYHGDSRELDAWIEADILVTDPPYGIHHRTDGGRRHGAATWRNTRIANDLDTAARDEMLRLWGDKPALVFGSWRRPRPNATRELLVWDKGPASGMGNLSMPWKPNHEEVYVLGDGFTGRRDSGVLSGHHVISWESNGRLHPHEKPLSLMEYLIRKCAPGAVADPFAGSGATLVAAKQLGRRATGVELDERYCEIAANRLCQDLLIFEGTV